MTPSRPTVEVPVPVADRFGIASRAGAVIASLLLLLGFSVATASSASAASINPGPAKTLTGDSTALSGPSAVAFDPTGNMYVVNRGTPSITVYPPDWSSGNVEPIKTLAGDLTDLATPRSVALDASGNMYIANAGSGAITMYASGWADGDTAPTKTLTGGNTGLVGAYPLVVNFDIDGNLYVATALQNKITVFAGSWIDESGPDVDASPIKTLTGLDGVAGMAVDSNSNLYALTGDSIRIFASGWTDGDSVPSRVITGGSTGLVHVQGLAVDANANMYVPSFDPDGEFYLSKLLKFASDADGDAAPTAVVEGEASGIETPTAAAFDSNDDLYVSNGTPSVTSYPQGFFSAQAVDFSAAPVVVVADSTTGSVTATGSGGTITYSTTSPDCSVGASSGAVTGVNAGTDNCTITASAAATASYLAGSNTQTFSVGKGTQTVTFDEGPNVNVGTTGTVSAGSTGDGAITYDSPGPACTVDADSGEVTGVHAGTENCIIVATAAATANYNRGTNLQILSIGKGTQTLTFSNAPTVKVGSTGTATATTTGSGSVTYSANGSACSVDPDSGVVTGIQAGTNNCTITATAAADGDYDAATAEQTLSIGANDPAKPFQQIAVNSCAKVGVGSIPADSSATLMKAGCITSAGQRVGVRIDAAVPRLAPRGDVRIYKLYCQVGVKTKSTKATGTGAGFRYCRAGTTKVRVYGHRLKMRVTWYSPATGRYAQFRKSRTIR